MRSGLNEEIKSARAQKDGGKKAKKRRDNETSSDYSHFPSVQSELRKECCECCSIFIFFLFQCCSNGLLVHYEVLHRLYVEYGASWDLA